MLIYRFVLDAKKDKKHKNLVNHARNHNVTLGGVHKKEDTVYVCTESNRQLLLTVPK